MQVISEVTGQLSDCTMAMGVELSDGRVIGAIADVDLFDMFTLDITQAKDPQTGENLFGLSEAQQKRLYRYGQADLWKVTRIPKKVGTLYQDQAAAKSIKLERMAAFYADPANIQAERSFFDG